ncbi:MAG: alpha/beta hydrolase fold domain-containing protein [Pseudomonadota bacterium]
MNNSHLPGRLGDPETTLLTDRRADPRLVAALSMMAELGEGLEAPGAAGSYAACLEYCAAFEAGAAATHPLQEAAMPAFDNVVQSTEVIHGVDGNEIQLYIHKPVDQTGPVPCILHTHGGGMVLMTAADPGFVRWRNDLAAAGLVVVGVEFRNGGGSLGNHPFPAGLNDCAAAAQWLHSQRDALGVSCVVISGESGGGNLSLATTLKAKQEGWLECIDGVYGCCPYISGAYANPPAELPSLIENDGYSLDAAMMASMVKVYDPELAHADNPLAWPLQATQDQLADLPPHVISVNELDPLRDEGLEYYRKLLAAGNLASARTVHGTSHAGDLSMPDVLPNVYAETLRSVVDFANSLVD